MKKIPDYDNKFKSKASCYRVLKAFLANIWSVIYGLEHGVRKQTFKETRKLHTQSISMLVFLAVGGNTFFTTDLIDLVGAMMNFISSAMSAKHIDDAILFMRKAADIAETIMERFAQEQVSDEDSDIE